jgi:hypothetical protein
MKTISEKKDIRQELAQLEGELKSRFFATTTDTFTLKAHTMWSNTARAYRQEGNTPGCYLRYTPTSIFRNWLHYHYFQDTGTQKQLTKKHDFEKIHATAVTGLERFWKETEPDVTGLRYFHFSKLIDLLFKSIPRWDELKKDRQAWFFNNVHVPLDKYSLLALREYAPMETVRELSLKSNPSMSNIESPGHYQEIQKAIRELIAPFPPLLFDLFAWDHLRKLQREMEATFELKDANNKN